MFLVRQGPLGLLPHYYATITPLLCHNYATITPLLRHYYATIRHDCATITPQRRHYYATIAPLLPHYYATITPLLRHLYATSTPLFATITPLLRHYTPLFATISFHEYATVRCHLRRRDWKSRPPRLVGSWYSRGPRSGGEVGGQTRSYLAKTRFPLFYRVFRLRRQKTWSLARMKTGIFLRFRMSPNNSKN